MNRIALCAAILALSTGSVLAMGNPASLFCEKMNGRLEVVTLAEGGQIGLCFLPDERIIEEWTLFRMYDGKIPSSSKS